MFLLIWSVLAIAIGLLALINPRLQWRLNQSMNKWQYRNGQAPEPSNAAMLFARAIGALFLVIGIVCLVRAIGDL